MKTKNKFNWVEIQKYYDNNHTIKQCMEKFNIKSSNSFTKAMLRNEFSPRNKSDCQLTKIHKCPVMMQKLYDDGMSIRELINKGYSQRQIRKKLKTRSLSDALKLAIETEKVKPYVLNKEQRKELSQRQSLNNSGGKCKWYEVSGIKVQGTWERNLALKLNQLNIKWIKPSNSNHSLKYEQDNKIKIYTPDFYLEEYDLYLEIKGYWWGNDKEKMNLVLDQNPNINIKIIEKQEYYNILNASVVHW